MEDNVFGEYGFANSYEININTPSQLGVQTTIHEAFHMIFTLQSPYGNFIHMNRRLSVADGRFLYINKVLAEHCRQVQEAASVFAEITYLDLTQSFESAMHYIQKLRADNREYFNYLKPLCPFLEFLEENKDSTASFKLPIIEIFALIKSIVLISLDVDLTQLAPDVFCKEKTLDRCIAGELCPNRIFRDTVKQILNILKRDTYPEKIQKDLLDFIVEHTPVYNEENLRLIQERHRQFFKRLYHDSPNYSVLMDILSEFTIKEMDPVDIMGSRIPTTGNPQYPLEKGDKEDIIKWSKEDVGVLFILGDMSSAIAELSRKIPVHSRYHNISRNRFCITFLDYTRKKQYTALLSSKQAKQLCRAINTPIVVNYKVYHAIQRKLLHTSRVPVFAYCDRSYINAVEVIRSHTNIEKRFQLVSYQKNMGFEVLVIEIEQGFYFLLPMMNLSLHRLFQDIQNGTLKLKRELTIDDNLRYTIDTVINCIFYY